MTPHQCATHISNHPDFQLIGCTDSRLYARNEKLGAFIDLDFTKLPPNLRWSELEPVLIGERKAECLRHVARIVGYYQVIQNSNASRVREIRDRFKVSA